MNIKKLITSATASLLIASALIGCGTKNLAPTSSENDTRAKNATALAYKYGEAEKKLLASDGLFEDFENYSVGTVYKSDTENILEGMFTFRTKYSAFEIVASDDGNALRYERSAASNSGATDPHVDIELSNKISANVSFVAEVDIMPVEGNDQISLMQTIYRPASGNIFSDTLSLVGSELKCNGKNIATVPKDEFTKIACVMHQSKGAMDVYVNGKKVASGLSYLSSDKLGHTPAQVRLILSKNGTGVALLDNVAVYRGSEPRYIDKITESEIEMVREYRFEGAVGSYAGESGLTLGGGKSTYNIIKTPDGRSSLKHTVKGADSLTVSAVGCEKKRCFSMEVYLSGADCDYSLVTLQGDVTLPLLQVRGTVIWDVVGNVAVYDLGVDKWARVDLYIDGNNNSYNVYVNGYRYIEGRAASASAIGKMTSIRIGSTVAPQKEYSVYLDNVMLYNASDALGYNGTRHEAVERIYTVVSPDDFSVITPGLASELTVTDAVKGSGETTARLSGFTKEYNISLKNTGITKQATGDYDLTDVDAVRIRYYSPQNAGRAFVFILNCGDVYKDNSTGEAYYDGTWKETYSGSKAYTCDKYPGVTAEKQWSYYHYIITLDSEGWATVTLPLSVFKGNRIPDWRHVESIRIAPQGWNLEKNENETTILPDSKAEYYLDTIELIKQEG